MCVGEGVFVPPFSCFALVCKRRRTCEFTAFLSLKQVGNGLRSKWHGFFFFFSFCVCALKRNSQKIRKENYAGCCYQLKVHSFLSQVPLLCICWCLFASKPKYFYCFVLKTCYSLFNTCWAYSVFNEYHILFFFFFCICNTVHLFFTDS